MSARLGYFLGFIVICLLLLTSLDLQFFHGIMPCPLCTLQRIAFVGIGLWLLIGFVLYQVRAIRILMSILTLFSAVMGFMFAARQVWLQHFPPTNGGECGVSLQYMLQVLPVNEVLQKIFAGTAECTQRGFEFLSISMAQWSAIWFVLFIILGGYLCWMEYKKK